MQGHLPISPWSDPRLSRLPGILPLDIADWIIVDDAFDFQMTRAEDLLDNQKGDVLQCNDTSDVEAANELLSFVIDALKTRPDYKVLGDEVIRPDGKMVKTSRFEPLEAARRLVQQDWCLMRPSEQGHVLSAAALCFPASWTLDEKINKALIPVHKPVQEYGEDLAKRVQRLFDAMRDGRLLWRANWLLYEDAELFQPRRENARRIKPKRKADWMRVERQSLRYLPRSGYTVFGIHTYVVHWDNLSDDQRQSLYTTV